MLVRLSILLSVLLAGCVISQDGNSYTYYEGVGYYKYHAENVTWYDAWLTCYNENAKLVVINSLEERELVAKLVTSNRETWTSIGFHSLFKKNSTVFVTVDGERLDNLPYMEWRPYEPTARGYEFCGNVFTEGLINDADCDYEGPFICEIS